MEKENKQKIFRIRFKPDRNLGFVVQAEEDDPKIVPLIIFSSVSRIDAQIEYSKIVNRINDKPDRYRYMNQEIVNPGAYCDRYLEYRFTEYEPIKNWFKPENI